MTPEMAFECLLVSSDSKLVNVMSRLLEELSVCTNLCLNPRQPPVGYKRQAPNSS